MKLSRLAVLLLSLLCAHTVFAAPTGEALKQACMNAMSSSPDDLNIKMCEWYVTPCDCDLDTKEVLPRVCLPDNFSTRSLARIVINELDGQADLLMQDASVAVAVILSERYPCPETH